MKQRKKRNLISGQGIVEYALIISLVVVVAVVIISNLGNSISKTFCNIAISLGSDSETCTGIQPSYCNTNFSNLNGWDFNRNGANYWQSVGDQMCMTHDSYRDYAYNSCSQSLPANDYSIHLNGAELTQGPGYGIFFRLQQGGENPTGYAFQYDVGAHGFVFRRWENGSEVKTLAYKNYPGYQYYDTPRDIEIKVQGDQFSAYIDGELVLTAHDANYTTGSTGFRTWRDTRTCFNDFSIDPLTE